MYYSSLPDGREDPPGIGSAEENILMLSIINSFLLMKRGDNNFPAV
jgi:hypothetical protein